MQSITKASAIFNHVKISGIKSQEGEKYNHEQQTPNGKFGFVTNEQHNS